MDIITMIGNTGTYLDSPYHRYEGGADLSGLDLATLVEPAGRGVPPRRLARAGHPRERLLRPRRARQGRAAAHRLGRALRHPGLPARARPSSPRRARDYLVEQGVTLVGIDSLNIDDTESGGERPAHTRLLAAGIHVVEHLTHLGELPPERQPVHRGAAQGRGLRHLPGARLRDRL